MNVALYYPWVYLTSGAERTILELVTRSRHRWTIFTNRYEPASTFPGLADCRVIELAPRVSVRRALPAVARAGMQLYRQRLPMEDYDALVVVCEGLGDMLVFRNPQRPIVCLCLTPLRIVFDEHYRRAFLAQRGLAVRVAVAVGSAVFRWIDQRAWQRYAHVVCISEEVKRRVLRGGLAPEHKLEVAYVGLGFAPPAPSEVFEEFFLLPGRIMWTKNVELGIRAFQQFAAMRPEFGRFRLVVAGIVDEKSRPYLERLRELAGGDPAVEFRIHPSDAELGELYRRCYGVLFTAFNEDWGIVPIEGMAFGKPVVSCNQGGPRESVEHGVQGYLEPPEPAAFARRMAELAADPAAARAMGQAGRLRAGLFTWDRFTGVIDQRLEELGPGGRGPAGAAPA